MGIGIFAGALQLIAEPCLLFILFNARYHIQKKSEAGIAAYFQTEIMVSENRSKKSSGHSLLRFYLSWKVLIWLYWASDHSSCRKQF